MYHSTVGLRVIKKTGFAPATARHPGLVLSPAPPAAPQPVEPCAPAANKPCEPVLSPAANKPGEVVPPPGAPKADPVVGAVVGLGV